MLIRYAMIKEKGGVKMKEAALIIKNEKVSIYHDNNTFYLVNTNNNNIYIGTINEIQEKLNRIERHNNITLLKGGSLIL